MTSKTGRAAIYGFMATAALAIHQPSTAQTWEEVYQPSGGSTGSWSEIECKDGSGWQKCEKLEPVLECKPYNRNSNSFAIVGQLRGGSACGRNRIAWNGKIVLDVTNGPLHRNLMARDGVVIDGYRYTVGARRETVRYSSFRSCNGGDYDNLSYDVCRIEVK